jgi:hypothetical protein
MIAGGKPGKWLQQHPNEDAVGVSALPPISDVAAIASELATVR